jgi:ABC-type transporter Mla MlaB component
VSSPAQPEASVGVLGIAHPIAEGDVPRLCERLRVLLSSGDVEVVVCDVRALAADAVTVDALARLQLTARRHGRQIKLHRASRELEELLSFAGLAEIVGLGLLRPKRLIEEREQPRGVEERVDRNDAGP